MARLAMLVVALAFVCLAVATPDRATAVAWIRETNPTQHLIMGQVYFYQDDKDGEVRVEAFIFGNENYLNKKTNYGMQIHEYGDITWRNGRAVGPVFEAGDDADAQHGCPDDNDRFTGDLGNFYVNDHHQLNEGKTLNLLQTYNSTSSIIGRAIVLNKEEDTCRPGFVGSPLAFGTIGLARRAPSDIGVKLPEDVWLVAYLTGSGACYSGCDGKMWATQSGPNTIDIIGKVGLPLTETNAHRFAITQYGDITTRSGNLMGGTWDDGDGTGGLPGQVGARLGDLGNNQYYVDHDDDDDDFTDSWIQVTIFGRLSDIAGRGVQVFESYDRGNGKCKNGGGGRLMSFGVFGVANSDNEPPSLPPNLERVGPLDLTHCSGGFLGVGLVSLVGLLVALIMSM